MFSKVGLVGAGPMGCALAQNLCEHGIEVKAWDHSPEVRSRSAEIIGPEALASSLDDMVAALNPPRCVLLFLPSGSPVDETIDLLRECLGVDDIITDCGNSHYRDTERRQQSLQGSGINLMGVGISGGPAGGRTGPAIMAGGDRASWQRIKPVFRAVAAISGEMPCCGYFGEAGAGHFVKMVHNGIEYGVMHLLAELHGYLERGRGMDAAAIASAFTLSNRGLAAGYLTEITSQVAGSRTHPGDRPLVDIVDDAAEQKGTGGWTVQAALDFGAAVPTIAEAVMARSLSSNSALRQDSVGSGRPKADSSGRELDEDETAQMGSALALAVASTFAQGLALFSAVGDTFGNRLDRTAILRTWRQGCILRGEMVTRLIEATDNEAKCINVLSAEPFPKVVRSGLPALRAMTSEAIAAGIPMACFASALAYVELLDGGGWPGSVIQLQRDYFGSHGLRHKETRVVFHGPWHEDEPS